MEYFFPVSGPFFDPKRDGTTAHLVCSGDLRKDPLAKMEAMGKAASRETLKKPVRMSRVRFFANSWFAGISGDFGEIVIRFSPSSTN